MFRQTGGLSGPVTANHTHSEAGGVPMEATVSKLKKNASAELWVCLREYQGRQYVDVREHFLSGDDRQWHPTKKGIMIAPALLAKVIEGVEALEDMTDLGTVATIEKSSREEIQVGVRQYEK